MRPAFGLLKILDRSLPKSSALYELLDRGRPDRSLHFSSTDSTPLGAKGAEGPRWRLISSTVITTSLRPVLTR